MATRMSAVTLDLSRYPPPQALLGLDYEVILQERLADLIVRADAKDIPFEVNDTEYDPIIVLEEVDASRELKVLGKINDTVRSVMVAFARGTDLDHLAAFWGVSRPIIKVATNTEPAVYMDDTEFRRLVLLAPEAFSTAGTLGGYIFHALYADPINVGAVNVWTPSPGRVTIAVQGRNVVVPPEEVVDRVSLHLNRDDIRPLTDVITVRAVQPVDYSINVTVYIHPGPDANAVVTAVTESINKMAKDRKTPSRDVPVSAVISAASLPMVERVVVHSPASNVAMGLGQVAVLQSLNVEVVVTDD